jgi:hypothetical protein
MSLDFIRDGSGQPRYIDSNPRLAETGNALASGVNLPELLVRVSSGDAPSGCLVGLAGIRTFMGVQGLLRAASETSSRRQVARTVADLVRHRGWFAGGSEELTPGAHDALSMAPLAIVGGALLVSPRTWAKFSSTTVNAYAATTEVVRFVRGAAG